MNNQHIYGKTGVCPVGIYVILKWFNSIPVETSGETPSRVPLS